MQIIILCCRWPIRHSPHLPTPDWQRQIMCPIYPPAHSAPAVCHWTPLILTSMAMANVELKVEHVAPPQAESGKWRVASGKWQIAGGKWLVGWCALPLIFGVACFGTLAC